MLRGGVALLAWVAASGPITATKVPAWSGAGPPAAVTALAIDGSVEARLYAATPDGIYRSDDRGRTWTLLPGSPSSGLQALAVDPAEPLHIMGVGCGARESQDGGAHWADASAGLPTDCSLMTVDPDPLGPGRFLASGPAGLFREESGPSGRLWSSISAGLFSGPVAVAGARTSNGDPILYAAAPDGIYETADGVSLYRTAGSPGASVHRLSVCCSALDVATDLSAFRSWPEGWVPLDPALVGFRVSDFAETRQTLGAARYAATDRGVYRGAPPPLSWEPFSLGLPGGTPVRRIVVDPYGRSLVALVGSGAGTFRYEYPPPTIRFADAPASVLVTGGDYTIEIDPPQPFAIELQRASSDPAIFPETRDIVPAFAAIAQNGLFPGRTSAGVTVTVTLPPELGGQSVSFATAVLNPQPLIAGIDPVGARVRSPGLKVRVFNFSDTFFPESVVYWNGTPRPTTLLPSGACPDICVQFLQAEISAEDLAQAGTAMITVVNPGPGGGASSPFPFTVEAAPRCSECGSQRPTRVLSPRPPR